MEDTQVIIYILGFLVGYIVVGPLAAPLFNRRK